MREVATLPAGENFVISPRMASALTDPLRTRILAEIDLRPLSPSQFVRKVGGEISSTARCFRQLERWGYAEVVGERERGRGGVATQRVYRALSSPSQEGISAWELSPSDHTTLSRRMLVSGCAEMAAALGAGTFDQELDRHFSWQVVLLDRRTRRELNEHLESVLACLADLDREPRRAASPGEAIRASLALAAFRSNQTVDTALKTASWNSGRRTLELTPQLMKALSNRWRSRILRALLGSPMSPTRFVEAAGGDHSYVSRCFRELAAWGWVEVDEERRGGQRGGGVERVYRLVRPPYFDCTNWHSFPSSLRAEVSHTLVTTYFERVCEAIEAGSLDGDPDRHVSWKPLTLDREAWVEIGDRLNVIFDLLPGMQEEAMLRAGNHPGALIPTLVGVSWFRPADPEA